mmetsp:Transcript_8027/g.22082  ORF Transcript_8027/g.22082 Transcript_8027/m.22082 type:complete len:126 (-) Transcript_8027:513-890(-)
MDLGHAREMYGDRPSSARCVTGTVCSLGIGTLLLSIGFSAHCMAHDTPDACSINSGFVAVNAAVCGLILITLGGICLTFYDCFRIEHAQSEQMRGESRRGSSFRRMEDGDDDGMLTGQENLRMKH